MARRSVKTAGFSGYEKICGGLLLVCYLTVFPLLAGRVFDWTEFLLGISLKKELRDAVYYYMLFALTLMVFGRFWVKNAKSLFVNMPRVLSSAGLGLIAFYGLNVLSNRLLRLLPLKMANLNDAVITTRLDASPGSTIFIVVFLAPIIEETFFRGYIFGLLRERHRAAAYAVSCMLWAMAHVWQYVAGNWTYLWMIVPYIAPGLVMAWTCERAGSLWGSVLLHSVVNGLAVRSVL